MMRSQAIRNAMAPAVIAMAVIFGLEMLLVQPLRGELATARAELDSARSEIARLAPGIERAPREQARLEALERIADEIESRSAMSSSASAVYDRMMSLAGARGIHIERMQPSRETVDGTQGFSLTVVGGFDGIIGLLEDIEAGAGFARTTTVRVAGAGRGALRAAIETVHYELPSRIEPVVAGVETEETP